MKLVVIYGPVASGKLTTARELAKITSFKIFHNHLTNDLLEPFYNKKDPSKFWKINNNLRLEIIKLAAKEKINLIFTFCYDDKDSHKFIASIVKKVEKHKGKVCFVQLAPEKEVLYKRIKGKSRKEFNKTKTKKVLDWLLRKFDFYTSVRHKNNLKIDNTKSSARQVAKKIKMYYKF